MNLTLAFLVCLSAFPTLNSIEQSAVEYFLTNVLNNRSSKVKILEFNSKTISRPYSSLFCDSHNHDFVKRFDKSQPTVSVLINAEKSDLKIKKIRANSKKLKMEVYSHIEIEEKAYVVITLYKKLRYVEYYFIRLNKETFEVEDVCQTVEII